MMAPRGSAAVRNPTLTFGDKLLPGRDEVIVRRQSISVPGITAQVGRGHMC